MTAKLTDYTSYADALRHCSKDALWELFDGDKGNFNIGHECLDRHPRDDIAVHVVRAEGGHDSYTFGELSEGSSRFANLLKNHGVKHGDCVAVMLDPCYEFYVSMFGTMKAGCVGVPLFTLFGPDGLRLRVDDCEPRILITTPEKASIAEGIKGLTVLATGADFRGMLAAEANDFKLQTSASDLAVYQYTSGTTRELPKAVHHTHGSLVTLMLAALYGTGIRPGDNFMVPSSPAWGHGLWHGTIAPFALGVTTASYAGKFDPSRCIEAIRDLEITNLSVAATHFRMMRRSGAADNYSFEIDKLSFTGEPLDTETDDWVLETFGKRAASFYGTTEVGVILVSYPGAEDFEIKPGSLGKPVPGIRLEIHDSNGKALGPAKTGEIMLNRRSEWFPTKDLGQTDGNGYFYHGGRADDVIITAGYTMGAVEIENVLLTHADIDEVAVIGVPDEERGQVVKAVIVSKRQGDASFTKEIQHFAKERLSRHEYPRLVAFVENLPKTPVGKINRKKLREAEQGQAQVGLFSGKLKGPS